MSGQIEETNLLQPQPQSNNKNTKINPICQQKLSNNQSKIEQLIDPVHQLLANSNALPIIAVLDHFDINSDIQTGTPLLNLLVNKFLPLDIILKDKIIQFKPDSRGKTPLHIAVEADDAKAVYWCLSHGHQSVKDKEGNTPIMIAVKLGYRRCFLLCLEFKHYDNQIAHMAAAYNRVWQLQVMQTFGIQLSSNRDSQLRSPLDVAVENYSYQAAQYLVLLFPSINIDHLENLTDSTAIIRRMKKARIQNSVLEKKQKPLIKVVMCFILTLVGVSLSFNQLQFYLLFLGLILMVYISMAVFYYLSPSVKKKQKKSILYLLKAPDFPTMEEICPKCFHFVNQQYDHCDEQGCCIRKFHFYDFICVNYSNQHLWAFVELLWLILMYILLIQMINSSITLETNVSIPILLQPLRTIQKFYLVHDYPKLFLSIWSMLFGVHQTFVFMEVIGIMFMNRTFRQVNNTQKYRHLYKIVKLRDGTYRNKQIRVFQEGFFKGLIKGIKNISKFIIG